ncbi:ATP-dependent DNA helicase [Clostridium sp. A1-XYC3]|uniref:ATP-dependent DNA helicase n=1 Tax=Clostridium tanneri TaxID=3037988 RepID=A0ABU4JWM8_9CLOT|nr:ATP-dependent DNA helicase [Clostridium sp. A1-XYC3]MDW8802533.1 ATP-dependent DNA helicase [Clostridium sp. A1-XYC3]
MESNIIRISVRNLVEFILRSGDLDSRFTGFSRAQEGTKAHQKLQKEYKDKYSEERQVQLEEIDQTKNIRIEYNAEVSLKHTFEYKDFSFVIEGRADGIIVKDEEVTIDEIKSVTRPLEFIDENYNPLHWAQAKCYAYIYGVQNNLSHINVQISYYNLNSNTTKRLVKGFDIEELQQFLFFLLDSYYFWANFTRDWMVKRNISIKNMSFPFEAYRKGQRELAVAVYGTIKEGKKLFAQAPTGIGKTISTLFPSVKAMGEGLIIKVFYLTAKTITRTVVEETVLKMGVAGLQLKTITLTAKDKICFQEKSSCNPEDCQYAKGHFDRVNEAIKEILTKENIMSREVIVKYSDKYKICPFEFSLDLALLADCVICDYNYAFDPRVYLRRFFDSGEEDYVFLIDEAHNLVDRAREMFSAELNKSSFLELKKVMKKVAPKIARALEKINSCMLGFRKLCEGEALEKDSIDGYSDINTELKMADKNVYIQKKEFEEIYPLLRRFSSEAEEFLTSNEKTENQEELLELYFNVLTYTRIAELYDEHFVNYLQKINSDVKMKIFCLDPSHLLREAMKRAKAIILFSATLSPMNYFKEILGGTKDDYSVRLLSPFSVENRKLLIADRVSTKYKHRENTYSTVSEYIKAAIDNKVGNYLVFFPSYSYMERVYEDFSEKYPGYGTIIQKNNMVEEEREIFLGNFQEGNGETLVAFAVLGGVFSEGIDLKENRLIGAVIVGVGLPQLSLERDIIMDYFNKKNSSGYEYSYMYPGMNKVLQAAGRVIRTERDKGVILLIDERFGNRTYKNLFPKEWHPNTVVRSARDIQNNINDFWRK